MNRFAQFERVTVFGGIMVDRIGRSAAPPVMGASNPGVVRVLPGGVGLNVASGCGQTDGQCIGVKDFAPTHSVQIASR